MPPAAKRQCRRGVEPLHRHGWCVAVHAGVGDHAPSRDKELKALLQRACAAAAAVLEKQSKADNPDSISSTTAHVGTHHPCLRAVVAAVAEMEDDPLVNAGLGSNLTERGEVECDASVMVGGPAAVRGGAAGGSAAAAGCSDGSGSSRKWAGVAAAPGLRNPVHAAERLLMRARQGPPPSLGRVPPMLLCGKGATRWCRREGLATAPAGPSTGSSFQVSADARRAWERCLREEKRAAAGVDASTQRAPQPRSVPRPPPSPSLVERVDTVGALCMDCCGNSAAGCSSGGLLFKVGGRVGSAASYGAGVWAADGVAAASSGTGEQLIEAMLPMRVANSCANATPHVAEGGVGVGDAGIGHRAMADTMHKFLQSGTAPRNGGVLLMRSVAADEEETGEAGGPLLHACSSFEVCWGHTTTSMAIAFISSGSGIAAAASSSFSSSTPPPPRLRALCRVSRMRAGEGPPGAALVVAGAVAPA
jgi:taspase (threonine aspartase 1)